MNNKTIEETYTKLNQHEHILLRPDTYIGSMEKLTTSMWVMDENFEKIIYRECTYIPGLYKIFDEIIVNAADNKQRDISMTRLEVTINIEENYIRIWNNGKGIPIVIHQDHGIYIPELIFSHLLTGSNFNDSEEKTTGGRNGYGAKLTNIFSTKFEIELGDSTNHLRYHQTFLNNMKDKENPKITKYINKTDYTCITFYPDLKKFQLENLNGDWLFIFAKRAYDIAGVNHVNVIFNNKKLDISNFSQYIKLYDGLNIPFIMEKINERWEIGIGVSDGTFHQVSFVNSISTIKGGTHVNYIIDQIVNVLQTKISNKQHGDIKGNQIKNHISLYVNCLIVNPSFDSQTKELLTTKVSSFGSECRLTDKIINSILKSDIVSNIKYWIETKKEIELKKKSGNKSIKLVGIPKLDDANWAGSSKSSQCTLILTEGDSAKSLAISGLSIIGRDKYGVFPLKGKLLNVREASHLQIMNNEEIQNLVKIIGLTYGKIYDSTKSLRYGHLMIMTDQDQDGSHIKGLLINFIHFFWPSLLECTHFLQQFITPIVKCNLRTNKNTNISFYTIPQYNQWKQQMNENDLNKWIIKYYKGLGTSTSYEAREYFSQLNTHQLNFIWETNSSNCIELAFSKKRIIDRKEWLLNSNCNENEIFIDYSNKNITYQDFINKELILFSHTDNKRSLPHLMDGFKPSQRKVLYGCFKRNLFSEIKVANLAGYISEHSAYHHGEMSLTQTIIAMAQNFIGSNNINLLTPCGQFGTRLMGGKDAASSRYIFTKLESITRSIFIPEDDFILTYLDDDGQSIEPLFYIPIIPMILVNGCQGIGTGWSTYIPSYNPIDIIHNIKQLINNESLIDMHPWSNHFQGNIIPMINDKNGYKITGLSSFKNNESHIIQINELPLGIWTNDYKKQLEEWLINKQNGFIMDIKENHSETIVDFQLTCHPDFYEEEKDLQHKLKLEKTISLNNMHAFNIHHQIKKYESANDILKEFYVIRLEYYEKRKQYLIHKLVNECMILKSRVCFINMVINGKLILCNRKRDDLIHEMRVLELYEQKETSYDYLLNMKLVSLTMERVEELELLYKTKEHELNKLYETSIQQMWLEDLTNFENALRVFYQEQCIQSNYNNHHEMTSSTKKRKESSHDPNSKNKKNKK